MYNELFKSKKTTNQLLKSLLLRNYNHYYYFITNYEPPKIAGGHLLINLYDILKLGFHVSLVLTGTVNN